MDQRAGDAVANEEPGTCLSTFEHLSACCHRQPTLIEAWPVAVETVFRKQWLDIRCEINFTIRRWRKVGCNFYRVVMQTYLLFGEGMGVE